MTDSSESATVYEDGLRFVLSLIDWLNRHAPEDEFYISEGTLVIESKNDYPLGVLTLVSGDERWQFAAHDDRLLRN